MDDQYLATIQMVGYNFIPRGFGSCSGSLIDIAQNTALYSLIGTYYGGNGRTTFGLPDFRGRAPVSFGTGNGMNPIDIGQTYGAEFHTLSILEMPAHTHTADFKPTGGGAGTPITATATVNVISGKSGNTVTDPTDAYLAQGPTAGPKSGEVFSKGTPNAVMASDAVSVNITGGGGGITGGSVQVDNTGSSRSFALSGPRLAVNFIICMEGTYPSRN